MKKRAQALTLKTAELKTLIAAEAVDTALLKGVEGGFHIIIGFGVEEKPLGLAREDRERLFKTLAAADRYLASLGIVRYGVDRSRHAPPAKRSASTRPDRAKAPERMAQAVEKETDFRKSVETAIAEIDAGTAKIHWWSPEDDDAALAEAIAWARAKKAREKAKRR